MYYLPGKSLGITEDIYRNILDFKILFYVLIAVLIFRFIIRIMNNNEVKYKKIYLISAFICGIFIMIHIVYFMPYKLDLDREKISDISIGTEEFGGTSNNVDTKETEMKILDLIEQIEFKRTSENIPFTLSDDGIYLDYIFYDDNELHMMQFAIQRSEIFLLDSFTKTRSRATSNTKVKYEKINEIFKEIENK